jgi:hypothetical protein
MSDFADLCPGFGSHWIPTREARDVHGFTLDSGHYLAEEVLDATAGALIDFLTP